MNNYKANIQYFLEGIGEFRTYMNLMHSTYGTMILGLTFTITSDIFATGTFGEQHGQYIVYLGTSGAIM